ncbi:MAG: LPS export ABC transporter periplasmic protein LptC [Prevotellaceae bacterium]|nr:LPS export ABC transporter periplasmic protein LptC [Prevotellaceae bacterium]
MEVQLRRRLTIACLLALGIGAFCSCEGDREHIAEAVADPDSVAFMRSKGICSLISDSGVLRYKLIAEEWDIYTNTQPSTWKFMKGLLMQRFDQQFQIDLYVQADTAYLHEQRTWELRGRVVVRNVEGTIFKTEELFWDMADHEMWNTQYMRIVTPERELEGTDFRSNEAMTDYRVSNSIGKFPVSDTENEAEETDSIAAADTIPEDERFTPNGERVGRVMPTAPGKHQQEGHFK